MKRSFLPRLLLSLLICSAILAAPTLIYDNGAGNLDGGFPMTHWKEANSFTLNAAYILQNVKFRDIEFANDFQSTRVLGNSGQRR